MTFVRPVTIGERIVVHLSQYARHEDAYVCPPGMAQAGIADSLGITRAHTAIELKRQIEAGRIETRMAHVVGVTSRRKVYALTRKGEEVVRTVRERALRRQVALVGPDGGEELVPGGHALEVLRHVGVPEARGILLVMTRRRLDLREDLRHGAVIPRFPANPELAARARFNELFYGPITWQIAVLMGPPIVPPVPAAG